MISKNIKFLKDNSIKRIKWDLADNFVMNGEAIYATNTERRKFNQSISIATNQVDIKNNFTTEVSPKKKKNPKVKQSKKVIRAQKRKPKAV